MSDSSLRSAAQGVIVDLCAQDPLDYVRALRCFVETTVKIVDEPDELLITPVRMLEEIRERGFSSGDCDDVAMLGAALMIVVGNQARFKAILQAPGGWFQHVFFEYYCPFRRSWIPVDLTMRRIPVYESDDCLVQKI